MPPAAASTARASLIGTCIHTHMPSAYTQSVSCTLISCAPPSEVPAYTHTLCFSVKGTSIYTHSVSVSQRHLHSHTHATYKHTKCVVHTHIHMPNACTPVRCSARIHTHTYTYTQLQDTPCFLCVWVSLAPRTPLSSLSHTHIHLSRRQDQGHRGGG